MHTLLGLSSLAIATSGSALIMRILTALWQWSWRRAMQLLVLVMPLVTVGFGLSIFHSLLHHLYALLSPSSPTTLDGALPAWLDNAFPISIGLVVLGSICFQIIRLLLIAGVVRRSGGCHHAALEQCAHDIAQQLGTVRPRVLLCSSDRPLAFTSGMFHPTILLSTWMVEHLDQHELEAVLAHELGHLARFDHFVILLATGLHDAFFYLPTSRRAYRQLQQEKELACDDLAACLTKQPLTLASALKKVNEVPPHIVVESAQSLPDENTLAGHRIRRLLDTPSLPRIQPSRLCILGMSILMVLACVLVQGISSLPLLAVAGCNPLAIFAKLL